MEKQRKKQIFQTVDKAYKVWCSKVDVKSKVDDIEATVAMISEDLAFGTIIVSGKNNLTAYIGQYRQCKDLQEAFEGQVGPICNVWYWIGYADAKKISDVVRNLKKNLIICIPPQDMADAVLNIAKIASFDIQYGDEENGRVAYMGNFRVCQLLKNKYHGKIGKIHNQWHWIGYADFDDITAVCQDYQCKNRRFHKKRIVL